MTSRDLHYRLVDVFTENALEGNPIALFIGASGVSAPAMQRIAREMNLSAVAFVLAPTRDDCSARLRIFTTTNELKFSGGPAIGAAHVMLDEGIVPARTDTLLLEADGEPVAVRICTGAQHPMLWLSTPSVRFGHPVDAQLCARALGLDVDDLLDGPPQYLSAGNPTVIVPVKTQDVVNRAWVDLDAISQIRQPECEPFCLYVFTPKAEGGAYCQMFAPEHGVTEDSASASLIGPLARFMMAHGMASKVSGTRFVVEQSTKMGRRSLLHVCVKGESGEQSIEVGGHAVSVGSGYLSFDFDRDPVLKN